MNFAIVLAAGKGTRMKSELPKGSSTVLNKSMVEYSVSALEKIGVDKIVTVVGYKKEIIMDILKNHNVDFAEQVVLNGTAKAVESAKDILSSLDGNTIITPCDMPLLSSTLFKEVLDYHISQKNDLTVLSSIVDNPFGYGRIVRDKNNNFLSITEELDATLEIKKIKEVNSGVFVVCNKLLFEALSKVSNNNKKQEYYLTDIVSIILSMNKKVDAYIYKNSFEVIGVNDTEHLKLAEQVLNQKIIESHRSNGVIINGNNILIGPDVAISSGVTIGNNVSIFGESEIGENTKINENTYIDNSIIGKNVLITNSTIKNKKINDNTIILNQNIE